MEKQITGVVGQEPAVEYLNRELRGVYKGQPLPFLAMYDDTGLGKTHLCKAFLAALPSDVRVLSMNCKEKLNLTHAMGKEYFEAIHSALAEGVRTIVHLDEFGNKAGSGSLQQWISTHISKIPDGTALAIHGGDPLPFNPRNLGFMVSSFAPEKVAVDIVDRIKQPAELVLSNYSHTELAEILRMAIAKETREAGVHLPRMSDAAVTMISRSMRGNARQANDIAKEIRKSAADDSGFSLTLETGGEVMKKVGVYPHGLNQNEVKILSCLSTGAKNTETLKTKTGVKAEHWARALNYLQEGTGRGVPFQICSADGTPVPDACGGLIDYENSKFHLTLNGTRIVAILRKKGWVK